MIKLPGVPIVTPLRQVAVASLLALTLGGAQAGIIVDHFNYDQLVRSPASGDPSTSTVTIGTGAGEAPAGSFIGTSRTLTADVNGASGSIYAASNSVNPSSLVMGNSGDAAGIVTVVWSGLDNTDFTIGGALGIYLAFSNAIDHSLTITLEGTDDLLTSAATLTFPNLSKGGGFFFPFATFRDASLNPNGALFGSIDTFSATFTSSSNNWDADVSSIVTTDVPIPGVLGLMVLGLTGLRVTRRSRA